MSDRSPTRTAGRTRLVSPLFTLSSPFTLSTLTALTALSTLLVLCSLFLAAMPAPAAAQAKLGPGLEGELAALGPAETITVVVTFEGEEPPSPAQVAAVQGLGITEGVAFRSLPIVGVTATANQVRQLAGMPGVRSIWPNAELEYHGPADVEALLDVASSLSAANAASSPSVVVEASSLSAAVNGDATKLTGVDRVRTSAAFTALNGGVPVSGSGVAIVINDSGIDATHKDLEFGRAVIQNVLVPPALLNPSFQPPVFVEDQTNTDLNVGHGTFVAGNAAGRGVQSGGKFEGVAPGAKLIGVGSGAGLFILNTLAAYDYMLTHQFDFEVPIRVMNNSWGPGGGGRYNPADPIAVANKAAHDRGIVVVFSGSNAGPGSDTMNPHAEDPNTIGVAAGDDQGSLTDFSSRGIRGEFGPDITGPGEDIVSVRASTGFVLHALDAQDDASRLTPAELPFYTIASGTSFSAPHVAGIVALLLDANPALSPDEVKRILQETATNMPGFKPFQVGPGYVNAFAAVQTAFEMATPFGSTVLALLEDDDFASRASLREEASGFQVETVGENTHEFQVAPGAVLLEVSVRANGAFGATGNTAALVLVGPDGREHGGGIPVLFATTRDRFAQVIAPAPGKWTAEIRGLRGTADNPTNGVVVPETLNGSVRLLFPEAAAGLSDIGGHPAEEAILLAVEARVLDGFGDGTFQPGAAVTRADLARGLLFAAATRQFLPPDGSVTFGDVGADLRPFAEAVAAEGAALRDLEQDDGGVMRASGSTFDPASGVTRAELAFSLIQSLGLEDQAAERAAEAGPEQEVFRHRFTGTIPVGSAGQLLEEGVDYQDFPFKAQGSAREIVGTLRVEVAAGGVYPDIDLELWATDATGGTRRLDSSASLGPVEEVRASLSGGDELFYRVVGFANAATRFEIASAQTVADPADASGSKLRDLDEAPGFARGHVVLAADLGIMEAGEDHRFEPNRAATRAEFAEAWALWRARYLALPDGVPASSLLGSLPPTRGENIGWWAQLPDVVGTDIEFQRRGSRTLAFVASMGLGFKIIDITEPTRPVVVGAHASPGWQNDVTIEGNLAILSNDEPADPAFPSCETCGAFEGIELVDTTIPNLPRRIVDLQTDGGAHNTTLFKGYAYISNASRRAMDVVDVSDPAKPEVVLRVVGTEDRCATSPYPCKALGGVPAWDPHDITAVSWPDRGDRAYVGGIDGSFIVDIDDPLNPRLIAEIPNVVVGNGFSDSYQNIQISHQADPSPDGTLLVISDERGGGVTETQCPGGGLHVWDISDETSPRRLGVYFAATTTRGNCTAHNFRFLPDRNVLVTGWYTGGTWVVDMSGPAGPFELDNSSVRPGQKTTWGRTLGFAQMPGADTWASKSPGVLPDGRMFIYTDDMGRGMDVFEFEGTLPPPPN